MFPKKHDDMSWAERQRWRSNLRESSEGLYDRVLALLQSHDIMVLAAYADDEYIPEADVIVPELPGCQSAREVQDLVIEKFRDLFGEDADADDPEAEAEELERLRAVRKRQYSEIADDIWNACLAAHAHSLPRRPS